MTPRKASKSCQLSAKLLFVNHMAWEIHALYSSVQPSLDTPSVYEEKNVFDTDISSVGYMSGEARRT